MSFGPVWSLCVWLAGGSLIFAGLNGRTPQLPVVACTLAIAALFNPLRQRIRGFTDRCFYRKKYHAQKTLEDFSMRLREDIDLDALNRGLVGETVRPGRVSLWLRSSFGGTSR